MPLRRASETDLSGSGESRRDGTIAGGNVVRFAPALNVSEEEGRPDWIALQLLANTLLAEVHMMVIRPVERSDVSALMQLARKRAAA